MPLKRWEKLPPIMQRDAIRPYYERLRKKWLGLLLKRGLDIVCATVLLLILSPVLLLLGILVKVDSPGPILFKQTRVTRYGKLYKIWKFRTMVVDAEKLGNAVTTYEDPRITNIGKKLRKLRLDELPQLVNVLAGSMSFVGARPEAQKYVEQYTDEMFATLLLPAGITSEASIRFKDEELLLRDARDVDQVYVKEILPQKMAYNLTYLREYRFWRDIRLMFATLGAVLDR